MSKTDRTVIGLRLTGACVVIAAGITFHMAGGLHSLWAVAGLVLAVVGAYAHGYTDGLDRPAPPERQDG